MIRIEEYLDRTGRSPFRAWFDDLDIAAATKVTTAIERLAQGHRSSIKSVGKGVSESRIDFGPGYRVYFGKDGERLIVLLGGGTKKRQQQDIEEAQAAWQEYRQRKLAARRTDRARPATKPKDE